METSRTLFGHHIFEVAGKTSGRMLLEQIVRDRRSAGVRYPTNTSGIVQAWLGNVLAIVIVVIDSC